ncbi:MAG: hypothetical protein KGZ90_16680 [Algoriphagus sp.]|nr:hypothetical protein [Algoriphagus sp.]
MLNTSAQHRQPANHPSDRVGAAQFRNVLWPLLLLAMTFTTYFAQNTHLR